MVFGIFKASLCLRDRMFLYDNQWKFWKSMEPFHYFNFETDFLENESLFEKLEYCFLVERTNTENASFTYKTAISEVNVKANRIVSTKWTYHRERSFASTYFIFLKILFQFKNLL